MNEQDLIMGDEELKMAYKSFLLSKIALETAQMKANLASLKSSLTIEKQKKQEITPEPF